MVMLDASPVPTDAILALRERHRREMACQIVLDSWHARGWTDSYMLFIDGAIAGYGAVGDVRAERKDNIIEFYVLPEHRGLADRLFRRFVAASGARRIEAQTNDPILLLMLLDSVEHVERNEILFRDALTTDLAPPPGSRVRPATADDRPSLLDAKLDAEAGWLIELDGAIVAAGGLLFHYNPPHGDIYMAVAEPFRRRGLGSYLIQELKRACHALGKVPAARCNPSNLASRASLQKAGMHPCARVLTGTLMAI